MEWCPVPSLQFQSAVKVTTHVFSRPAVVGHHAWFPTSDLKKEHEEMKKEIIATLPLPLPVQEYMLSLTHSVLRQLNDFYKTVAKYLFEAVPDKFPLKTKEEILLYVCWNAEGCINLVGTVKLLISVVIENGVPLSRNPYKEYILTCSYLLHAPIYYVWRIVIREDREEVQADALSSYLADYVLYQKKKILFLKNEDFCMAAVKMCIYKKNFAGVRICWPYLPLHCKNEILKKLLDKSYDILFRVLDDIIDAEIVHFCLLHCGESDLTAVVLRHMSKSSCWLSLLWVFWLWPEKSVFQNILELAVDCLGKTEFSSQLLTLFKNQMFDSELKNYNFFKDVWKNSPRAYRKELLREGQDLVAMLTASYSNHNVCALVAVILESYTLDEKRLFLMQHGFKVCAKLFADSNNADLKDIVLQEFHACQIDIKARIKEILITNPPCDWIMGNKLWYKLNSLIEWSALSWKEKSQIYTLMDEYSSRNERLQENLKKDSII